MKSSIEKLKSELQAQDDNGNQLLIVGKRAMKELAGLQAALEDVSRRNEVPRYKFHRDPETEKLIASEKTIGRLEEDESTSALGQQHRQQQTKQEQRQQETMQQHQKQMKAVSQNGESTAAAGQQKQQQQNEQQPRQLETMQQQQKHMQDVSPKAYTYGYTNYTSKLWTRTYIINGDTRVRHDACTCYGGMDPASEKLFASCTTIGRVEQVASDLADQQTKLQGPGKQLNTVDPLFPPDCGSKSCLIIITLPEVHEISQSPSNYEPFVPKLVPESISVKVKSSRSINCMLFC
ncbi:hypothetical protein MAR_012581 [Mya arenaria]|uniref:Uncharacterized protein n=1 Tax=Mya arenaria TaxID=6604 RepID=A0ABY7G0N7_MYAAR|nr:hypothetical protein MAR_012581 [Mya arenaria]